MSDEYSTVGLYDHNIEGYTEAKDAYARGEQVVGTVRATGTGKSYIGLQLAYDNKDKKALYVVPSNSIIEHIEKIIEDNPNLDREKDFPNLELITYQSLVNLSQEELANVKFDLLILDEFHHLGAPVWSARIDAIIKANPKALIFGMTAYTVRDRGTSYERDMANPDGNELFSNKIVGRYDLVDAMIDGVLPSELIYRSAITKLLGLEQYLEERLKNNNLTNQEYQEYLSILNDLKKRIAEAPGTKELVKKHVKPNGKYIYFCPPGAVDGTNDIDTIMAEAYEWFKSYIPEEDIIFYKTTSEMGKKGKDNRDAFYNDLDLDGKSADGKLRVIFAINQYNEGVHAPNIDGVIMGRATSSDIVFFEQLGRGLAVRGDYKKLIEEYEHYSMEELRDVAKSRDIEVDINISKEKLIKKLIAPVIIDLTNNYDFIKELENNLKDRVRQIQTSNSNHHHKRRISQLTDIAFDIEILNRDLFGMLSNLRERLRPMSWEDWYNLAKIYYDKHGNLEIKQTFKTINGYDYDENGVNLGIWINNQRNFYQRGILSEERRVKLEKIGMQFEVLNHNEEWEKMYKLATAYYEKYGNLEIKQRFKTINGYEYDENGVKLGSWITRQRVFYKKGKLSEERKSKLEKIRMIFENINFEAWEKMYDLAKGYYEKHGNLEIKQNFKTINGYEYDENGVSLGSWENTQRNFYKKGKLSEERRIKLEKIGMRFEVFKRNEEWEKMYELAKVYYEKYGNLEIKQNFKTINGYEYDETGVSLGSWENTQRNFYKKGKLSEERRIKLEKIGMRFEVFKRNEEWEKMYELAKVYYDKHDNLEINERFKTINGYEYDENGVNLGNWINTQRKVYQRGNLSEERIIKLEKIGMRFEVFKHNEEWEKMYELAKVYYEKYGNLEIKYNFKTINGYEYDETGVKLGRWINTQRGLYQKGKLSEERRIKLEKIGMIWEVRKNKDDIIKLCEEYNINYKDNKAIVNKSYNEIYVKICYLLDNKKPLMIDNQLNEIFFMSDINMQANYNVSLEELVNTYLKVKGKGV